MFCKNDSVKQKKQVLSVKQTESYAQADVIALIVKEKYNDSQVIPQYKRKRITKLFSSECKQKPFTAAGKRSQAAKAYTMRAFIPIHFSNTVGFLKCLISACIYRGFNFLFLKDDLTEQAMFL